VENQLIAISWEDEGQDFSSLLEHIRESYPKHIRILKNFWVVRTTLNAFDVMMFAEGHMKGVKGATFCIEGANSALTDEMYPDLKSELLLQSLEEL
jgi:hypothetical protein